MTKMKRPNYFVAVYDENNSEMYDIVEFGDNFKEALNEYEKYIEQKDYYDNGDSIRIMIFKVVQETDITFGTEEELFFE